MPYLIFAEETIIRDSQIAEGKIPETDKKFEDLEWNDIEKDVLLCECFSDNEKNALEYAAQRYNVDIDYLYAIKIKKEDYKKIYYSDIK